MRPENLNTKIFLDSGDPDKTEEIRDLLGFLDGQTTNPSLISRNPEVKKRLEEGEKFSRDEIINFYRDVVDEISSLIPEGDVSVEVYADKSTQKEEILDQARQMFEWSENLHIKFPTTSVGIEAAQQFQKEGGKINFTLCFKQEQAAAVHSATKGADKGDIFISPFIGRLDDRDKNGMDLIENILRMYSEADSHVEVLAASIRNIEHFMKCLQLEVDIITAPYEVLKEWGKDGTPIPGSNFEYDTSGLNKIEYEDLDLTKDWREFDISHKLTTKGMKKFSSDWNDLIK